LAVGLSCIINIALNLRNHGQSLIGRHAALTLRVIIWAYAASLSEIESAGEEELWAGTVAVVQNCAGSVHGEVQTAAVAVLWDSAVTFNKASFAGDLGLNERSGNAARAVGCIGRAEASIRSKLESSTNSIVNSGASTNKLSLFSDWVSGIGA
jgi:hypothetical protein